MIPFHFALVTQTSLVKASELYRMASALEACAKHCAETWGRLAPAIDVCDDVDKLPKNAIPVVFVDSSTDMGAIGVHYWTPQRGPAARVYVEQTSGLNAGSSSVSEAASHEILEALVSPQVNLWADYPGEAGGHPHAQVAVEPADPCQDTYVVTVGGTSWQVANFATPEWFDKRYAGYVPTSELKFDYAGRLRGAGKVGPEGYVVLRAPAAVGGYVTWLEDAWGPVDKLQNSKRREAKAHAWSRTKVRLGT
jgi:hypothetical protein